MNVFYILAVLACPLGMGTLMWLMMRSGKDESNGSGPATISETELARLRADLNQLRASKLFTTTDIAENGERRTR